ncbi:hypothetical protein ACIRG4_02730 [Streptomyces sp. NPDC102395]|uniref:hypothetical protein n=1 Tax=Streptomyces sp. NPDC102395 TaxID=3366168 RepID=UPI00382EFC01
MNGDWLIRGRDGRLCVYLTSDDGVLCRAEQAPGGSWQAPRKVGGDQKVHPVLAAGRGVDGYAHLVSWRPLGKGEAGVVHSTHFRPLLSPMDWTPLGHPDTKGDRTGPPAVAVDHQGRAHVFVRCGDGGLRMIAQKEKGGWGPWRVLEDRPETEGAQTQGPPAAMVGESGCVEVYTVVGGGILRRRQDAPAKRVAAAEFLRAPVRPGTLRALATSSEETTLFYADDSGDLRAWRPGSEPVTVAPVAGPGPVAAVRCELDGRDVTLLAQRSTDGRVAFTAYRAGEEAADGWTESGPTLPDDTEVALAKDDEGRVVAAALSPSTGRLLVARLDAGEPGPAPASWQEV